jgi:ABC-type branched-subunit amino acid transport system substrate-binding protein
MPMPSSDGEGGDDVKRSRKRKVPGGFGVPRRPVAMLVSAALLSFGAWTFGGVAGASTPAANSCTGDTAKIAVIADITVPTGASQAYPEVPEGAKAAAKAANKTCEAGQPIEITTCDASFSADTTAACAREAVADDVIASVGMIGTFIGGAYPILNASGAVTMCGLANEPAALTAELNYPCVVGPSAVVGQVAATADLGAKKVGILTLDVPQATALVPLVQGLLEGLGVEFAGAVTIPPTANDMTQYVAQLQATDADGAIVLLGASQVLQVLNALSQAGVDLNEFALAAGTVGLRSSELRSFGDVADGLILVGTTWPTDQRSNSGIKQYFKELKAAGLPTKDASSSGVNAWAGVHIIAQALQKAATKDSAGLAAELNQTVVDRPELPKMDYSTNPFPGNPILGRIRVFQGTQAVMRAKNGKMGKPITGEFVPVDKKVDLTGQQ